MNKNGLKSLRRLRSDRFTHLVFFWVLIHCFAHLVFSFQALPVVSLQVFSFRKKTRCAKRWRSIQCIETKDTEKETFCYLTSFVG